MPVFACKALTLHLAELELRQSRDVQHADTNLQCARIDWIGLDRPIKSRVGLVYLGGKNRSCPNGNKITYFLHNEK